MENAFRIRARSARWLLVVVPLLLNSCIFERSQDAKKAQTAMIGMSRSQVLSCAGVPRTTITDGNLEYFAYHVGNPNYDEILGIQPTVPQQITGTSQPKNCTVRIVFRDGVVESVGYSGNTGGLFTQGEVCNAVVGRCVAPSSE
ncbi:MAG: hypothetical protein GY788_31610 [bacterium]|nr:hypothetical protein [bacterium]